MGDPKFARKHYTTPSHPWDGPRISEEKMIVRKYGLKNKRELWKTQTLLRGIRRQARRLQAQLSTENEQANKEQEALIERLKRVGLLSAKADLNDVLALEVETVLSRRLQTQIYLKGFARTVKQARQLIAHGHISIDGRKVTVPGYMVKDAETGLIDFFASSPFTSDMHPERAAADFAPQMTTVKEERRVAEDREREMRRGRELERIAAQRRAILAKQEEARGEGSEGEEPKEPAEGEEPKEPAEGEEPKEPAEGEKPKEPAEDEKPKEPEDKVKPTGGEP